MKRALFGFLLIGLTVATFASEFDDLISTSVPLDWREIRGQKDGLWRFENKQRSTNPILFVELSITEGQVAVYLVAPKKLAESERLPMLRTMVDLNHRALGANFELDLGDGEFRCKSGIDFIKRLEAFELRSALVAVFETYKIFDRDFIASAKPLEQRQSSSFDLGAVLKNTKWPSTELQGKLLYRTFYRGKKQIIQLLIAYRDDKRSITISAYPGLGDKDDLRLSDPQVVAARTWMAKSNFGLRVGYFDLDPNTRVLRFRHTVFVSNKGLSPDRLHESLMLAAVTMDSYLESLEKVLEIK